VTVSKVNYTNSANRVTHPNKLSTRATYKNCNCDMSELKKISSSSTVKILRWPKNWKSC